MKRLFLLITLISLCGCTAMNAWVAGTIATEAGNYSSAKANIEKIDDAKLQVWVDTAAALPWGAVKRCQNPNVVRALLLLHPLGGLPYPEAAK